MGDPQKDVQIILKRSVGQHEGGVCGGTEQGSLPPSMCPRHGCIHARRGIACYSKELQRRHVPPQACHSRCSVIHPVGDHNHQAIFFKIRYLLLEWSGQLIFLGSLLRLHCCRQNWESVHFSMHGAQKECHCIGGWCAENGL
jgi:hypothetical protein